MKNEYKRTRWDVNHMTGVNFLSSLFKRIRDCSNIEIGKIIMNTEHDKN